MPSLNNGLSVFLLLVLTFVSCGPNKSTNNEEIKTDTIAQALTSTVISDTIKPVSDTLFLGFRAGMSKSEYQTHLIELLNQKKLFGNSQELFYRVETRNNYFLEDMMNPKKKERKEIQTGVVIPNFFNDSLLAIKITFSNPSMRELYPLLLNLLNEKYYNSYDLSDFDNAKDSSKHHFSSVKWTLKNTLITLEEEPNGKPVPNVILNYECLSCSQKKETEKDLMNEKKDQDFKKDL